MYSVAQVLDILGANEIPEGIISTVNRPSLETLVGRENLVGAEIGTYNGTNALNIFQNLDIQKLYIIDPLEEYIEGIKSHVPSTLSRIKSKLKEYNGKFIFLQCTSDDAVNNIADGELDFVYIDGNHEYEFVRRDLKNYYPKVKSGGLICGHDFDEPEEGNEKANGVIQAVLEFFADKNVVIDSGYCKDDNRTKDFWCIKE
jgi:predicted O-methyltransferase YrrM